jgi:hypothetical protein
MLNSNHQTQAPGFAASANPGLETIEKWLRGLSGAEVRELGQALASRNAEMLARFHIRFQAWLERPE